MTNNKVVCATCPKPYLKTDNEDSVICKDNLIAISDGAGGYGILADKWSKYLLEKLPIQPVLNFKDFDLWLGSIWEEFFNKYEPLIKKKDPFVQNKFYQEGSCATLIAVWHNENSINWIQYGDSSIFIYNKTTKQFRLKSPENVTEFLSNPRLINWKDVPSVKYLKIGEDKIKEDEILMIASDALSVYLFLSSIACEKRKLKDNEKNILSTHLEQYLNNLMGMSYSNYYNDVIVPLVDSSKTEKSFQKYLKQLFDKKLIASDDYSFAGIEFSAPYEIKQGKVYRLKSNKQLTKFLDRRCI